jgi:hypothetical protein
MPGSVWETQQKKDPSFLGVKQSTAKNVLKHTAWPNPFRNAVKNIDVIACEHTWQAMIEMYFIGFGNWAWSSFVPSPVELTRKFVAGSYKCGFYLLPETASPLDIIWRDGRTSKVLAEIAAPLTKGLFYMWAGQTAFGFLSTWTSLVVAQEMCDVTGKECLLSDGSAAFGGGAHHELGDVGLYNVIYDPQNRYPALGGGPEPHEDSSVSATAAGQVVMALSTANNASVWIYAGQNSQKQSLGTIGPGEVASFSVSFAGNIEQAQPVVVRFEADITGDTIIPNRVEVSRFSSSFSPPQDPPPPGKITNYKPKDYMCGKLYQQIYASGVG